MIQITAGGQEYNLPIPIKDLFKKRFPLPDENAAAAGFDTPNQDLNQTLENCKLEGSVQDFSILAFLLKRMDAARLELLNQSLSEQECGSMSDTIRSAEYFCDWYLDFDNQPYPNVCSLENFHTLGSTEEKLEREFRQDLMSQRMTAGDLFKGIIGRIEEGEMERFHGMLDYVLENSHDKNKLTRYEFDFLPGLNFGGSEGIYIDCYLKGVFDGGRTRTLQTGTIKTLSDDLDACKLMGELCGVLLHYGYQYVNENIDLLTPENELITQLAKKAGIEPEEQQGNNFTIGG